MSVRARASLYVLTGASGLSIAGTAMSALAIPWLVLITTHSAARTGVVGFAEMAPYVVMQVAAAPLVDRLGAKRSATCGNAVAAMVVCAVPLLYSLGKLGFAVLCALVAVGGAVRGAADTATAPIVPLLARRGGVALEQASGWYSAASRTGRLLGAPLAGVVIAASDPATAVLVDGFTFALAAAAIGLAVPADGAAPATSPQVTSPLVGKPAGAVAGQPAGGYVAQLREGLGFVAHDPWLVNLVVITAAANLLDQALLSVLVPVWVRERLHDSAALGLIGGVSDAGALLGVLAAARLVARWSRRRVMTIGYLLGGAPLFLALATWRLLAPVLVVAGLAGLAGGVINPIIGAVSYERIPEALQARVLGAVKASAWLGIPFGSLLGGVLTASLGLGPALVTTGLAMLALSIVPSLLPAWRGVERPDGTLAADSVATEEAVARDR